MEVNENRDYWHINQIHVQYLCMTMLYVTRLLHSLTPERMLDKDHTYVSVDCWAFYERNPTKFLYLFVSDETSKQWTVTGNPIQLSLPKTVLPYGKIMLTVFGDVCGVIFIDNLKKETTISGKYYGNLFQHLNGEIITSHQIL